MNSNGILLETLTCYCHQSEVLLVQTPFFHSASVPSSAAQRFSISSHDDNTFILPII
jgi:hypothetical protein